MGNIKYQYALIDNNIINIDEVSPESRKATRFKCVSCGNELLACLGNKNKHHFRHKIEVDCNFETYLHKLGKLTFLRTYESCLAHGKPFYITIKRKVSCVKEACCSAKPDFDDFRESCIQYKWETFDLTQYYDSFAEEQPIGLFVADVLLKSSKSRKPILIEIKVSHACEENKIQSGYPIIEIGLKTEEDLKLIESCELKETGTIDDDYCGMMKLDIKRDKSEKPTITCYNFRDSNKSTLNLYQVHQFGILRKDPSRFSLNETVLCGEKDELIKRHKIENTLMYEILFYEYNLWGYDRFVFGVSKAFERGFKIRNCYLCRYHMYNENRLTPDDDKPIFCKIYKQLQTQPRCHSTQAINCSAFIPDKRAYENYLRYPYKCEEIVY